MKEITITSQAEFDALPAEFSIDTIIVITGELSIVARTPQKARILVRGSARIGDVRGSARIGDVSGSARIDYVRDSAVITVSSDGVAASLCGLAVAYVLAKNAAVKLLSSTAQIIRPSYDGGTAGWLDREGVKAAKGHV